MTDAIQTEPLKPQEELMLIVTPVVPREVAEKMAEALKEMLGAALDRQDIVLTINNEAGLKVYQSCRLALAAWDEVKG